MENTRHGPKRTGTKWNQCKTGTGTKWDGRKMERNRTIRDRKLWQAMAQAPGILALLMGSTLQPWCCIGVVLCSDQVQEDLLHQLNPTSISAHRPES